MPIRNKGGEWLWTERHRGRGQAEGGFSSVLCSSVRTKLQTMRHRCRHTEVKTQGYKGSKVWHHPNLMSVKTRDVLFNSFRHWWNCGGALLKIPRLCIYYLGLSWGQVRWFEMCEHTVMNGLDCERAKTGRSVLGEVCTTTNKSLYQLAE